MRYTVWLLVDGKLESPWLVGFVERAVAEKIADGFNHVAVLTGKAARYVVVEEQEERAHANLKNPRSA